MAEHPGLIRKRNIGESQNSVPPSPALPQAKRHAPNGFFSTQPTASTSKATPSSSSNSSSRASRKPRKNEQFQAYSMNGSPLDVSKWPQTLQTSTDQGPMNVPSSDFTFRMTLNSFAQGQ